ncbi:hypothetical protein RND81_08G033000 [Saponaria officinalis]|uniref:Aspartic peptidase DDI1-type domain-containing protein n=1 Tax=Saponaria officinalis TaxID=3572 RepID=A0AAW1J2M7_SAPOF
MMMNMQKMQSDMITQLQKSNQEKTQAIKHLETQMAQLATSQSSRQPGQLPPQGNPPQKFEHVNVIHLRSGKSYEGPRTPQSDEMIVEEVLKDEEVEEESAQVEKSAESAASRSTQMASRSSQSTPSSNSFENEKNAGKDLSRPTQAARRSTQGVSSPSSSDNATDSETTPPIQIKLPFPNRLRNTKVDHQFGRFMDVVKNLQVTVPFTELILQVPSYAKFMKDILTRKRSLTKVETVAFAGECNALLQSQPPPKLKDPGSFSIPCTIGTHTISNALCDLGASVSVLPYSICKKLGLGELKCTNVTLQMADRSLKRPLGILEDVPVKVGQFFFLVDFMVLDIPEDTSVPIILGRPFLHNAGALIDVGEKILTFKLGNEKLVFTQPCVPKTPLQVETGTAAINFVSIPLSSSPATST